MQDTTLENGVTDHPLFLVFVFFCKSTLIFYARVMRYIKIKFKNKIKYA